MPETTCAGIPIVGAAPGTVIFVGDKKADEVRIRVIDYDVQDVREEEPSRVDDCKKYCDSQTVTWINVDGLHEVEVLKELGAAFGIHSLVLEDIVNTSQRPKLEDYGDSIFIVIRMLCLRDGRRRTDDEQLSLVFGPGFVLTFQESPGDVFEPVRKRIRKAGGNMRRLGSDYLVYALIDAMIDNYFVVLEAVGDDAEALEEKLLAYPGPETLHEIYQLRNRTIHLRKALWPLREAVSGLQRGESSLIDSETHLFLRDLYDHTIRGIETVEVLRDVTSGMMELYLSSVSHRMNEVMKVLTIIATIFIPLTFVAGIYGMNFQHMPELSWFWGYPTVVGVMVAITVAMLAFFKRRHWL